MCGITGVWAFNEVGKSYLPLMKRAIHCLQHRGPDGEGIFTAGHIALGHRRLAVIDTSNAAAQPMSDPTGRYTIVFNGEFFNYPGYRLHLKREGVMFNSAGDTEVLLQLYIQEGPSFLEKINGFFALAIYDRKEDTLFIARDRMGVKPLWYYQNENVLLFASELKALLKMNIPQVLDETSLYTYMQLNYIPGTQSIFKEVYKLDPGHYLLVKNNKIEKHCYYSIPTDTKREWINRRGDAAKQLKRLLSEAVERRMVSDVPLGSFLSGGLDSSIVTTLAAKYTSRLKTFSIGYKDTAHFDETHYAELMANSVNADHTVFSLSQDDLYNHLFDMLDSIDEPFADSSALPVYILSKLTREHVTVALSGDGADELFAGYHKHKAEYLLQYQKPKVFALNLLQPLWKNLPHSRHTAWGNKMRQLARFGNGAKLSAQNRYWYWCALLDEPSAERLLAHPLNMDAYNIRKQELTAGIKDPKDLNQLLHADLRMVLTNDMLVKVDTMSMANSLEVRNPFLDFNVVNFAAQLPHQLKINGKQGKLILREAFKDDLPAEILVRTKKGFEVPLLHWMRSGLRTHIEDEWLQDEFIEAQGLFDIHEIRNLKKRLFAKKPGEVHAQIWALIVFQHWWKKYCQH